MIIMKITIRIYRIHDYDLMALHESGTLSIGRAVKKAIIAYYKGDGEKYHIEAIKPIPDDMPTTREFKIVIRENEAPGIIEWKNKLKYGVQNSCFKNILRAYLDFPRVSLYQDENGRERQTAVHMEKKNPQFDREHLTGSAWVEEVAKQKNTVHPEKAISDIDDLLKRASSKGINSPIKSEQKHTAKKSQLAVPIINEKSKESPQPEDSFDAFEYFNQMEGR